MGILEDFIKRGVRGITLSDGTIIHETDAEIIAYNILKVMPSLQVRSVYLQENVFDFLPDKERSAAIHLNKYIRTLFWYLEDHKDIVSEETPLYIKVVLHYIFLLSGHILRQQGSNLDDLLHNMFTYYEAYKIPMILLPQEVYENNEAESPLTITINQIECIRTEINSDLGARTLLQTIQQKEYNKQIENNEF